MKVICIDNKNQEAFLTEGLDYFVVNVLPSGCYQLRGMEINPYTGNTAGFESRRFVPTSSIDEAEFERNYNKQPEWIEDFNKITVKP